MLVRGSQRIAEALKTIPTNPGVYQMLDEEGNALYVGKARNLKARVTAYTRPEMMPYRIQQMISRVAQVEIVTTRTEAEALLVEANLIKKLKPRFNILLRDDKSFPYILIDESTAYPRITKHRGAKAIKGSYFGPFASVGSVNRVLAVLQRAFLLRPCSDHVFATRTRPCLQYQIKRCSAPCVNYISREEYGSLIDSAKGYLSGRSREIQNRMARQMQDASAAMDFEKAAQIRDRIRALTNVQMEQQLHLRHLNEADIIGIHREGARCCILVSFFRGGQNYGTRPFFPTQTENSSDSEVLAAFLGQFYVTTPPPHVILLPPLMEDAKGEWERVLSEQAEHKVRVHTPLRGPLKKALDLTTHQAKEALSRSLAETSHHAAMLEKTGELFSLPDPPERIEVYDNSHIMGSHQVGAMIVAGTEGFEKKSYRRYNIKRTPVAGDDYGMMREVLGRRFRKVIDAETPEDAVMPDLVLIDGGLGQLRAAEKVLAELGISVPLVAIAKGPDRNAGREQFFLPGREPFQLPVNEPVLFFLQRLRDEAHRFAIGSHRKKRAKATLASELDSIPGIGPTKKKALLHHFGSARGVSQAELDELLKVPGINRKTAEDIFHYFHG